jgi:hypothetical protein
MLSALYGVSWSARKLCWPNPGILPALVWKITKDLNQDISHGLMRWEELQASPTATEGSAPFCYQFLPWFYALTSVICFVINGTYALMRRSFCVQWWPDLRNGPTVWDLLHFTSRLITFKTITSPTSGGRSVGVVRSRTQTMEFFFYILFKTPQGSRQWSRYALRVLSWWSHSTP